MKCTHTTASTTFTTNDSAYNYKHEVEAKKKAVEKELDQTLFAKKVTVEDLPQAAVSSRPKDLIKFTICRAIDRLVDVLETAENLGNNHKKLTFDLNLLEEAKTHVDRAMGLAVLYKRYSTDHGDFFMGSSRGSKLVDKVRTELIRSLSEYQS